MSYEGFANYYDTLMEDMPYPQWIQFAESCWGKQKTPKTIVDLGCGTGNITIPLAKKGLHVFGVDLSTEMLSIAAQKTEDHLSKVKQNGGSITLLEQDMRELELPVCVDCIVSFCDCYNYIINETHVVQSFQKVYDHLHHEGLFIFDMLTAFQFQFYADEQPFIYNEDQLSYIWTCEYDDKQHEIEHDLTIFAKEDRANYLKTNEVHHQRAYPIDWVKSQLKTIGFKNIRCFGDFEFEEPSDTTNRVFFVAEK
ncbi:class I SAM-dependent DNA methyltransferase [Chengkuizengella axinellae]|uniref:Class I SAM-dependent methyltransferase n=1 Tax=Chengkuizengella axinellae TaxID=3064388 RepID=A0ABT9IUM4_9BACL|nr:class I SAM-dependent methyltransferase [Chengkuizengella sp. 2205SS18-9]MDP5273036.1 class I SAM-dependent methyltransferase [Chengkuizengella sp. 2205SS18-9]